MKNAAIVFSLLASCGPVRLSFESDRRINDHSLQYAQMIQERSTDGNITTWAEEIEQNCIVLRDGTVGEPSEPTEATPENSRHERKKSTTRHATARGLIETISGMAPWAGAVGTGLLAVAGWLAKRKAGTMLTAVMEGVDKAKMHADEATRAKMNETMAATASKYNMGIEIENILTSNRARRKVQ